MDLHQLRCFIAVAEELHFGNAARRLDMLPSALGRHIRLLEEDLGTRLLARTTRSVALSEDGSALVDEARAIVSRADALRDRFRERGRKRAKTLRLGAIDTAAAGLVPLLLHDIRRQHPDIKVQLLEEKTIRLLPRLLTGRIDLAFVRPPDRLDKKLEFLILFYESAVVAVPEKHDLARRRVLSVETLIDQPLIVPDRRSRPHSYDLTLKLFEEIGVRPTIAQVAEEKQTIINLVAAEIGLAIVPRWTSRMAVAGVRFIPLKTRSPDELGILPLAAAWVRGTRDPTRDTFVDLLKERLQHYAAQA